MRAVTVLIHQSVGDGAANRHDDVARVQGLLNAKGFACGQVDGVCGAKTILAIKAFQAKFLSNPDGVVDPGGVTSRRLLASGTPARPDLSEWGGDSARWPQEKKIRSLHPDLRPKVSAILDALAKRGFKPKIFYGWRSVAVQLEIFKRGDSKVKFSFHNAQKPDGTPNAYAADIVDSRWGWDAEATKQGFWKALGEEGNSRDLIWGGDWKGFPDWAHVQLVENSELGRVKRESGL